MCACRDIKVSISQYQRYGCPIPRCNWVHLTILSPILPCGQNVQRWSLSQGNLPNRGLLPQVSPQSSSCRILSKACGCDIDLKKVEGNFYDKSWTRTKISDWMVGMIIKFLNIYECQWSFCLPAQELLVLKYYVDFILFGVISLRSSICVQKIE
jgi:hypothetical protein